MTAYPIPLLGSRLLKLRRSKVLPITAAAFLAFPFIDGLFMFIMKDPEQARSLGLISVKAQMMAATADWNIYFQVLLLGTGIVGAILFAFITAWIFGREYTDRAVQGAAGTAHFARRRSWRPSLPLYRRLRSTPRGSSACQC